MTRDKQLRGIRFDDVLEKRRRDQALNAKEFAVVAGISYSSAREWFQLPGFPRVQGVVFWQDFVEWRKAQNEGKNPKKNLPPQHSSTNSASINRFTAGLPSRAERILLDAVE